MSRLSKRDAEALMASLDGDPIGALSAALRTAVDRPEGRWPELVAALPDDFSETDRTALLAGDVAALDRLAARLNEERAL